MVGIPPTSPILLIGLSRRILMRFLYRHATALQNIEEFHIGGDDDIVRLLKAALKKITL